MLNTFRNIAIMIGLLASLAFAKPTMAQEFGQIAYSAVNPDFNSGSAFGFVNGQNAVATSIQCNLDYRLEPSTGTAKLYTNITVTGFFGHASDDNAYLDLMEIHGLHTHGSYTLTTVFWNGEWYDFNNELQLTLDGHAGIYRDDAHTYLGGLMESYVEGIGAIPTSATSSVQIFAAGHPYWVPDWQVNIQSEWAVMGGFHAVPSPGSLAFLGVAGLISRRRRLR